ncbi:MAG: FAD-dependent oxidoreductase [Anaerolineae bacterium]
MTHITVVGGGLAGMITALRLLERGCTVTLYERSQRLGGQAGSNVVNGRTIDHGFHIFPMWYRNILSLFDELGIRDHFKPVSKFNQLNAGDFPNFKYFEDIASARTFWQNLNSGILPVADIFLFYYTGLELMAASAGRDRGLDQVSISGFVHSRWYTNKQAVLELQDLLLKAASAPNYRFSSMTMQLMLKYWVRYPSPQYNIARGSLAEQWIGPIQERLTALGCQFVFGHNLERVHVNDGRVSALTFRHVETGETVEHPVEVMVSAIPPLDFIPLLDDDLFEAAPDLSKIEYLDAEPMAALNIYCKTRIEGIPPEHVGLTNSRYDLSFIDVSQTWPDLIAEGRTVLNVVSSDYTELKNVTSEEATHAILTEMRRFIPGLEDDNIEWTYLQPHLTEPLFMNYVGSWPYRPDPNVRTQIPNLYITGTHTQTNIDLATMESAVEAGLRTAEAVRKDLKLTPPVKLLVPEKPPHGLLVAGKYLLMPAALIAKIWTLLTNE